MFIGEGEKVVVGGELCGYDAVTGRVTCGDVAASVTWGTTASGLLLVILYVRDVLGRRWTIRVKIPYDALADLVTILMLCSMACASSIAL